MKMYAKTTQAVSLILLTFSLLNSGVVNGDDDILTRLCKATTSYTACKDCVASVPGAVTTTDIGVVEAVMTCATKAMGKLYEDAYTYQANATDAALKDALGVCLDQDEAATPTINEVVNKVRSRDFGAAKDVIRSRILDVVNTCANNAQSKGIQLPQVVTSDLGVVNTDWAELVLKMLDAIDRKLKM